MRAATLLALVLLSAAANGAEPVDFRKDVYPLLHDRCFQCHQGDDAKSGIRLDTRKEILARAQPGKSSESLLVKLVNGDDPERIMPPRGTRLTASEVALLRRWIDEGIAWDDALLPPDGSKANHWAFQPIQRPQLPVLSDVQRKAWIRTPVDAFIARCHERRSLWPAPEADRRTMLRRLAFDLTGLPPTPEELDAFEHDTRPEAYERQVERLLASPAYGERWGRHWLDVARYADSEGYESDHIRPYAWRYRDYVVKAFNTDKPFDRFVLEQLAGDELTPYADEHLIATGFLAAARISSNEEDKARQFNDMYVDITNTTAAAFLGLTFNCAQCHAHKFDPITAVDYYRFQGFFLHGMPNNLALRDPIGWTAYESAKPPEYDPARKQLAELLAAARAKLDIKARASLTAEQLAAYDTPTDRRTPEQHALAVIAELKFQYTQGQIENAIPPEDKPRYAELKKQVAAIEAKLPDPPQTWGFYSPATSPHAVEVLPMRGFYPPPYHPTSLRRAKPFQLLAGDAHRRGPELEVGWPAVFGPMPKDGANHHRTTLAKWLTSAGNPLTARVWVNRIWHYHFGRGIVETGGDFGLRGSPPSHPELLDWLASELMRQGWSTKHIHRLIVNSATYRQAAAVNPKDPDNRYLSRWKPRRIEAEGIRDALLSVSGELDPTLGGKPADDEHKNLRRGLYQLQRRQKPPAAQALFDGPTGSTESCPRRVATQSPLHALYLMNSEFATARANAFAQRVRKAAGEARQRQIDTAFRMALCRLPTAIERQAIDAFFRQAAGEVDPLSLFCHALLATNEFTTIE